MTQCLLGMRVAARYSGPRKLSRTSRAASAPRIWTLESWQKNEKLNFSAFVLVGGNPVHNKHVQWSCLPWLQRLLQLHTDQRATCRCVSMQICDLSGNRLSLSLPRGKRTLVIWSEGAWPQKQ
jgi:hypothetical protein